MSVASSRNKLTIGRSGSMIEGPNEMVIDQNATSTSHMGKMPSLERKVSGILKLPGIKPIYESQQVKTREQKMLEMNEKCQRLAKGLPSATVKELSFGSEDGQEDLFSLLQLPAHYLNGFDLTGDEGYSAKEIQRIIGDLKKSKKSTCV